MTAAMTQSQDLAGAIKAMKKASGALPKDPRVLVVGPGAHDVAPALKKLAGTLTVVGPEGFDASRPWALRAEPCDLVVCAGLLNGPVDPCAWLDRFRGLAPYVWADFRVAVPSGDPITHELEPPYDPARPPQCVAMDSFERLGLHAGVASSRDEGRDRVLCIVGQRMDAAQEGKPLLVHVHVPKNGGMTVTGLLDKSFGAKHVHLYLEDPRDRQFPHRIRARLHERPDAEAISSHSFRDFPPLIGGRTMLYFTVLRDPAERYLSYMRYCQKNYDTLSNEHKAMLPEGFLGMGVVEYIRWQASRLESGKGVSSNLQCQYFAKPTNEIVAQQILRDFFFVGVTEEMELSVRVLREKARAFGIELADIPVTRENTTDELKAKSLREADDPEVKEFLSKLAHDRRLVKWAKQRLRREAEILGIS